MIEIMKPGSPAEDYWKLLQQQRVTKVAWGPMILSKLKQYYDDHLSSLPNAEIEPYLKGIRAVREIRLGSAMPTAPLLEFWAGLVDVPLQMGYAATEAGGLISTLPNVNPTRVRKTCFIVILFPQD
jgi:malonyl-CoA/methylmalonyl-CoA synthetase